MANAEPGLLFLLMIQRGVSLDSHSSCLGTKREPHRGPKLAGVTGRFRSLTLTLP